MLRATLSVLVKSHQLKKSQHPNAGTRYGRNYNRAFIKYGFGGYGMSVYSPKKNRSFRVQPQATHIGSEGSEEHRTTDLTTGGLSNTTRSLSPHWRSFALDDGGVLFIHPSHQQVMSWSHETHKKETEAMGMTSMDEWVNSRIQSIMADNTLENVSLGHWRRRHMWMLIKSHGKMQRRWGTPGYVKGMRSTLYGS